MGRVVIDHPSHFIMMVALQGSESMNQRTIISHLTVALAAFALGWVVFGSHSKISVPGFKKSSDPVATFVEILAIENAQERTRALLEFFEIGRAHV